jgi:hypothetical protein
VRDYEIWAIGSVLVMITTNRLELEKLNTNLEALIEKAQALGKDTTWMRSALQPHRGAEFVTRVFTSSMSVPTVQKLSDDWHQAVSMSKFSGQDITFPEPWYDGGANQRLHDYTDPKPHRTVSRGESNA